MEPNNQGSALNSPVASPSVGSGGDHSSGRKRKAPHEYSTNPNTIRVRERNAKLTPYRLAVERAKSNDLKAVSTAWKERVNSETFQAASEPKKQKILEEVEKEVMDRRRRKGIDAESKIAALNQTIDPGQNQPAPRSGIIASNTTRSLPAMAPPGYVPFPTQRIAHLMEIPKNTPSPAAVPTTPVSSSTTRAEDNIAQPSTESLIKDDTTHSSPVSGHFNTEVGNAIEDLKKLHEEEKTRHEAQIRELQGALESVKDQLQQLAALLQPTRLSHSHTQTYNGAPVLAHASAPGYTRSYTYLPPHTQTPAHQPSPRFEHRYTTQDAGEDGYAAGDSGAW
ncbi:hypothetical protein F5Y10DRAFT_293039 [Nemania abortiva]|nr:hypothetical protein F5Y10DRAFT_293039 [Nemania abortiva]